MDKKAPRNRTLTLDEAEKQFYAKRLLAPDKPFSGKAILDRTIHGTLEAAVPLLPLQFVDLLFLDPPYNLTKTFHNETFSERSNAQYTLWLEGWFPLLLPLLKPTASVYICGDWRSSGAIQQVVSKYLTVQNRITWEREKGRGAFKNWKNASEDIWFATCSSDYTFNIDAVKLKRKVLAPYRKSDGSPKGWDKEQAGKYRLTYPGNLWTDLTVPFWSMPENTDHPTQKPEKLLAKIILASSNPGDVVLDPFAGSGTAATVAKKLGRRFLSVEKNLLYCLYIEKRLSLAGHDARIQGYHDGVFWERNTAPANFTDSISPD